VVVFRSGEESDRMIGCPVCSAPSNNPFLVREPVPVHQNLVVRDTETARALNRGTLALHACEACGFVFNAAFDPGLLSYGQAYDNTQSCSPAFQEYVEQLAAHIAHRRGRTGGRVVEIGCGKGEFLRALARCDPAIEAVGFDPSYVGVPAEAGGRVRFERRFYDGTCRDLKADVVVCRHVIEHVPDPVALLRVVHETVSSTSATVFFETPCVEWILSNTVIWDVFYEHCSYFAAGSLRFAFERAGFSVGAVRHTFGGQYLWLEAEPGEPATPPHRDAGSIPMLARRFAEFETSHVEALRRRLGLLADDGPLALWGAAAKGATLANLVDPDRRLIACIVDVNPNKRGRYLPGTGHPIIAPEDLRAWNIRTALMTNPNYLEENARLLEHASLDVRLVDLMHNGEVNAHRH
jgi:SAM-dependent methyltransferase